MKQRLPAYFFHSFVYFIFGRGWVEDFQFCLCRQQTLICGKGLTLRIRNIRVSLCKRVCVVDVHVCVHVCVKDFYE